ncbi:MAG TPA: ABC transporter ATP-binding protein [Candidatus Nitrosotalea sp.]|nr:ABC transporter ATP-binding protein [Candidatus Nitrosotalea sp.]
MTEPLVLEVERVVKHFPVRRHLLERRPGRVRAVDGVDFQVRAGRTFGLVGESGCGKTTVAMLLVKLLAPTGGRITFEGRDLAGITSRAVKEFRRRVQIVFQDPYGSLDPRQTMRSALVEPLFTLGVARDRARALDRAVESVEMVGLDAEILRRLPHELSGGQRQRVVIARALSVAPRLLILDEPTSSVDVSVQAQILSLLADLKRREGLTYLLISHNLVVVRYMSDVVAVMYLGKIVEMAESAALFGAPLHPYSTALISAIPVPDPEAPTISALARGDVSSPVHMPPGCRYHPRCPFAERVCREIEPPLVELQPGHQAACHFPGVARRSAPVPEPSR